MRIKTYDFIIGYENKVRELESACLMKCVLEKRGYSVLVFQEFDQRYDDIYEVIYHAKVLILSCGYADRYVEKFVRRFISFDKLVNWQWEQVFMRTLEEDKNSLINVHGNLCRQAVQIAWGDKNIDRMTNLMGLPRENVIKTGLITMDFFDPSFSPLYKSREEILAEYNIAPHYKVAILLGVFSRAFKTEQQLLDILAETGIDFRETSRKNRERFDIEMDWILRALKEHEDLYFVYRPHPDEEYDRCPDDVKAILDNIQKETGRFLITQDYTIRQWFKVVDKVYTGFSTTMVDAYFAGKGCLLLSPAGITIPGNARLFEDAKETKSYDEFNASLSEDVCGSPLSLEMIDAYYSLDKGLRYPKVADAFIKVLNDDRYLIDTSELRNRINAETKKEFEGKSFAKRLKLSLWKYDWFYSLYWKLMKLPVKSSYFLKQREYKARIDQYQKNYVGSRKEIKTITEKILKCINK